MQMFGCQTPNKRHNPKERRKKNEQAIKRISNEVETMAITTHRRTRRGKKKKRKNLNTFRS